MESERRGERRCERTESESESESGKGTERERGRRTHQWRRAETAEVRRDRAYSSFIHKRKGRKGKGRKGAGMDAPTRNEE